MNGNTINREIRTNMGSFGRYTSIEGLQAYTSLGRGKAIELAKECGAVIKVGARVVYDLQKIDEYMASLATA